MQLSLQIMISQGVLIQCDTPKCQSLGVHVCLLDSCVGEAARLHRLAPLGASNKLNPTPNSRETAHAESPKACHERDWTPRSEGSSGEGQQCRGGRELRSFSRMALRVWANRLSIARSRRQCLRRETCNRHN